MFYEVIKDQHSPLSSFLKNDMLSNITKLLEFYFVLLVKINKKILHYNIMILMLEQTQKVTSGAFIYI